MRNTRLNGANLFNTSLQGAYLETTDCSLAEGGGLVLDGAEIRNSTFSKASLQGAVVHRARIRNTGFGSANLRAATLRLWQCEHMDFSAADLSGGLIEFWLNGESPNWDTQRFYRTVIYDDKTRVEGLRLSGVADPEIPFVKWALAHGAVLVESTPAPQETPPS